MKKPYHNFYLNDEGTWFVRGPDGIVAKGNAERTLELVGLLNRAYGLGAAAVVEENLV